MSHCHDRILLRFKPGRSIGNLCSSLPLPFLILPSGYPTTSHRKGNNNGSVTVRSFASTKKKAREVPWRVRPPMITRDEVQTKSPSKVKDPAQHSEKKGDEKTEPVRRAESGVPSMLKYDSIARQQATSKDEFLSLLAADGPASEVTTHSHGASDETQQIFPQHGSGGVNLPSVGKVELPRYKKKAYDYSEHRICHDFDFPPSWFNHEMSTEHNYGTEKQSALALSKKTTSKKKAIQFCGEFAKTRQTLDYEFHRQYIPERQLFQDQIIGHKLDDPIITDLHGMTCARPENPWLVFTAGAYGAGKSYTINTLVDKDRFPLSAFVKVDPDEIRRMLPEFEIYVNNPSTCEIAGELTRKEAGYMCEILTAESLKEGKNVLVDGSLRDREWYKRYFKTLREDFPFLRIAILHVTAPWEAVLERVAKRGQETGRVVPLPTLERAFNDVPESVRELAPLVDYVCELQNGNNDIELVTTGETWQKFKTKWYQICAEWY